MLSKRSLGCEMRQVPVAKRFRRDLSDVMLANELSAHRVGHLAHTAALAGASHVDDLAAIGQNANPSRDLLRRLLKGSKWPTLYHAAITVQNPVNGDLQQHHLPDDATPRGRGGHFEGKQQHGRHAQPDCP